MSWGKIKVYRANDSNVERERGSRKEKESEVVVLLLSNQIETESDLLLEKVSVD